MALLVPTPTSSGTVTASCNGESTTPASPTLPSSRPWKSIFQQPVNSWKRRQSGTEKLDKNALSSTPDADPSTFDSIPRSAHILSGLSTRRDSTPSSPRQLSSLQSESLDSLTSASLFSRNSYPSVISTGTDATSVSGVLTTCGVICCSVDSQFIRPYKPLKNNSTIYLAHDDVRIPVDVMEQWEMTDLERLKTDLSEVVMKIYRKGIERESRRRRKMHLPSGPHEYDVLFELRMSGRAARDAEHVTVGPSIWLICGSSWACKEITSAMNEITWPTLPVEIHEDRVPIPSIAQGQLDIGKLDLTDGYHLGNGITLYIHVEDSFVDNTSCGLLCCATIRDGDTYSHHFSRIGGFVTTTNTLTSSQFGVSTAHGMLDHPWWHRQLLKGSFEATWDCQSIESNDSEDEDGLDSDSLCDDQEDEGLHIERQASGARNLRPQVSLDHDYSGDGYRDPQLVTRWRNVSQHGVLSFLGASIAKGNNLQHPIKLPEDSGSQTDHAMIRLGLPRDTGSQRWNKYTQRRAVHETFVHITTHMSNDKLTEGVVSIICQENSPLDARLLPGSTCLTMGGRMFTLRKLKAAAPLARGVSGSWVARGTELCGMVIAVSNPEPYVYMMRAEDLMSNLGASSPSIETIEVFNHHGRETRHKGNGTEPRMWSSRKSPHRLVTAITSPRMLADEHLPITSIKRGLSTRLRALGASPPSHKPTEDDPEGGKGLLPRRRRSVRGLLSDVFRNKVEEIIQPADREGIETERAPEMRRPSVAGARTHKYLHLRATSNSLRRKNRKLPILEPISEVSTVVTFGEESVPDLEYVSLQSTACTPTTPFRHGPIRLHTLDLMPRQEPIEDIDRDYSECIPALSRTAYHRFSDSYEGQREKEVDEIGDLIDWWESWGYEDPQGLVMDEPLSPTVSISDSFPGVSYSDTTSENSISSCHILTACSDSSAQWCIPKTLYEYEIQDSKDASANKSSEGYVGRPSIEVVGELDDGILIGNRDGLCERR
ncbi:hypothetical protein NUW58_g7059 [Xylaria curta]|uniref:Uncharacterized protein n=1 Tax=Xylaria curta TaxID=42375 RepID=A0ACC1NM59_9PEZI|nr:hypothetical protein NUW58_g7059 [Xylaria curta]